MKLAPLALLLALTSASIAQAPVQFKDPANLRGERVKPRNGRELPIDTGASGLAQLLRKLNTRASILNIVAHPDDEDGGMLTLYSRGLGARVTDLSLTRGEGGQNAMTGDFEDALGLLRTQELLANDRYTGVDQLFGTEVDFGFSKTKSEAFAKWTHDRVLYDAVRAIRLVRPLVITATFIGGVTDGHGQHQVSGQIAQEAFLAAADPNVFPDMIAEGILPWQALRVYARVPFADINAKGVFDYATGQYVAPHFVNYVTGKVSTMKPPTDVIVPEGTPDPLFTAASANPSDLPSNAAATPNTPFSYAQFSRIGLFLQRSQIGKDTRLPTAGIYDSGYTLYGSSLCDDPATTRSPSISPQNCHPEQAQRAEGPATKPVSPQTAASFSPADLTAHTNFFTGIDTSILAIQDLAPEAFPTGMLSDIARGITAANEQFDPAHPEKTAPALAASLKVMDQLIPEVENGRGNPIAKANALHELRIKRVQLNDALALALGLGIDATVLGSNQVEDSRFEVDATVGTSSTSPLVVSNEWLESADASTLKIPQPNETPISLTQKLASTIFVGPSDQRLGHETENVNLKLPVSRPYFNRDSIETPVYHLQDPNLRNAPATPPALTSWATVGFAGISVTVGRIAHSGPQQVMIETRGNLSLANHAQLLPSTSQSLSLSVRQLGGYATERPEPVKILLLRPEGQTRLITEKGLSSNPARDQGGMVASLTIPTSNLPKQAFTLQAVATEFHHDFTEGFRPIGYGDLPRTNYYTPATTRIVPVDLNLPTRHNIAYLPGTGDAVPEALASINLTPTLLTVADLTPTTLAKYDTVILGVRTYSAHPDLHGAPTQALLDYARNGGNVVVQYQTSEFTAADAPYPLSLGSNEKVVDETAPVTLLTPTSTLLTTPNRITPADFDNWIEERGHGFLSTWDPHYTALTETHDPGAPSEHIAPQLPQRGGLITTPLGNGRWTYVAFALYRQLPEAIPGAYRLFLNLLNP